MGLRGFSKGGLVQIPGFCFVSQQLLPEIGFLKSQQLVPESGPILSIESTDGFGILHSIEWSPFHRSGVVLFQLTGTFPSR
jgi:hypothetical protein